MSTPEIVLATIAGTLSILGVLEVRMSRLVKKLTKDYLSELKPNGGSSVKDSITRLEKSQEALSKRVDDIFTLLLKDKK